MPLDRRALTDAIRLQHEREPFSGVVSVRERGEVVFEQGFGLAHRAERVPNTARTRFGIASGTKTLTAIAVAQLVEQGRSPSTRAWPTASTRCCRTSTPT
jgi:CubicO group peptidase (beta-lactamase class C family)